MFGEADSESPRAPSPWDSLVSTPASHSHSPSPSPLAISSALGMPLPSQLNPALLNTPASPITYPKLIPESDDGNIEYKLHLISPSSARFARLVTQMKWRLLEGGGQAYYELGVSDSGLLVGMSHVDLERSLETLEMMAGEIGASVIVVKEIEVPEKLVEMVNSGEVKEVDHRRMGKKESDSMGFLSLLSSEDETTTTEDDTEESDEGVFDMDADDHNPAPQFSIDIEIASVFKPRPIRARTHHHSTSNGDGAPVHAPHARDHKRNKKREKKDQKIKRDAFNGGVGHTTERMSRQEVKDEERMQKQSALHAFARESLVTKNQTDELSDKLQGLHVSVDDGHGLVPSQSIHALDIEDKDVTAVPAIVEIEVKDSTPVADVVDDDDDVFPSVSSPAAVKEDDRRLIVEALVVRKLSLDEAFLDFGGFAVVDPGLGMFGSL